MLNAALAVIMSVMRIRMTKYGWPQAAVFPLGILAVMVLYGMAAAGVFLDSVWSGGWAILSFWTVELVLVGMLALVLFFFRDPRRTPPSGEGVLVAPADGRVTDIELVDEPDFIGGRAFRIGIFLSILDVHINRAPCAVRVERITYRRGKYENAKNPRSGRVNESNDLWLVRTNEPYERLVLRQISGAIARRIVCSTEQGQRLATGERFGMIKFGSRTELYIPASSQGRDAGGQSGVAAECLISVGDRVKAGESVVARYRLWRDREEKVDGKACCGVCEGSV